MLFYITGGVGILLSLIAIVLILIFHAKAKSKLVPVIIYLLGFALFMGSGFMHWKGAELELPGKGDSDVSPDSVSDVQVPDDISPQEQGQQQDGILLGNTYVLFELHPVMSGTGDNYLFDITVGETTKEVIENVSSDELTTFMESIDFEGTNGNAVLMFEDGTGLTIMDTVKTYTADYGYVDVSEGQFTMVERLGAIWNDTGDGWYYMTIEEMQAADAAN